jgi:DNA-binding transcriptional LysR family regulator
MSKSSQRGVAIIERSALEPKINPVSWDDIRVFLVCAETESFRKAASALHLSTSTVTRRIERFERAVSAQMFDRVPDGIILTSEGHQFLESAREMEHACNNVLRRQSIQDVVARGPVSISITEGLGSYWVMPRLVDFQRHYPFININLRCAMESADVLRLEADMAVQFSVPPSSDLMVVKLGRLHVHPFASKEYLKTYGIPKTPADILEHRIVQQVAPGLDEGALAGFFGVDSIENIVAIRTNASTAHFYAIEKGAGIGVLPTFAVALGSPVVPVDIGKRYHLDIFLTYHPDARKTPRRSLMIDWLKRIFDPKVHPWFRDEFVHPNDLISKVPAEAKLNFGKGYLSVLPK